MPLRGGIVRTLPEQIADDLGAAIAHGEFEGGERLQDQEIAYRYGVSRGPVREALRILARRCLAVLYPRRGAFVTEVSVDSFADLFNTRAVLMSLAAKLFARRAPEAVRAKLAALLGQLGAAGPAAQTTAPEFVQLTSEIGQLVSRNCGSEALTQLIEYQNESSAWRPLWRSGRIDFETLARRAEATADYLTLGDAIAARDGAAAEAGMRRLVLKARRSAVAALAEKRGETFDDRGVIGDE